MKPVYEFGPFRLDPAERLLLREGQPVALTPKAFDLLVYLVEHHHRLAEKQALISAVWADTIVEETNLAYTVSALRKALADGRDDGRFIETVPTRGYRFVAPVVETRPDAPRLEPRPRRWQLAAIAVVGITAAATAVLWTTGLVRRLDNGVPRAPVFRQLTANPAELPVLSGAISPDGKYLAYADRTGIRVQIIDTGESQPIPNTRRMFVSGWSDDGTKIRALDDVGGDTRAGWEISLVGDARRRWLEWPGDAVSLSPDSSNFLKLGEKRELQVVPMTGGPPRAVLRLDQGEPLQAGNWTADAKRVFLMRGDGARLETFAADRGGPSVVFTPPAGERIRNFCIPGRDGRLIVLMGARDNPDDVNVWEIRTDLHTGAAIGQPRRLRDWREGRGCWQISASADGKRIVLLTSTNQPDVYVAAFDRRNARVEPPKRFSMSERLDYPSGWTPDSKSIIFTSTRVGPQGDIYKQDINAEEPQLLVTGEGNKDLARVTGDGRWILFVQSKVGTLGWTRGTSEWANTHVMRAPIDGGMTEEIYASSGSAVPQCSISGGCIVADAHGNRIVISRLDPIKGKGPELATVPNVETAYISPDGTEFSYVPEEGTPQNHIRIISFVGNPTREIVVSKASFLYNLDWLPDGSGWLAGNITEPHNQLLFVARDGTSHVLWAPEHTSAWSAQPSPDSKYVAIWTISHTGNAWLLTGY